LFSAIYSARKVLEKIQIIVLSSFLVFLAFTEIVTRSVSTSQPSTQCSPTCLHRFRFSLKTGFFWESVIIRSVKAVKLYRL
jgi:hypothetical protein